MKKLLILVPLLFASCSSSAYLNSKNAQALQVQVNTVEQFSIISLSGQSATGVKDVSSEFDGDVLILKLKLAPAQEQLNGNFAIDMPLPADINKVALGRKGDLIWVRP